MKSMDAIEKLSQADLTDDQAQRLFEMIAHVFAQAIDARSPRKRPPGKAGLNAEKGYYRLLYLEDDFQKTVKPQGETRSPSAFDWSHLSILLSKLNDLPELKRQLLTEIDAAVEALTTRRP
ncbi:hypothetical protein DESC_750018 [Desulfosarcina cetonica]|uniref:hypothetical protein n=1 Tax=Desulfosarcina cetonica TaxID=90730 RepID=UPI0006D1FD26|nr:hypothetical protein [Desulfosarcina cetonica]VTR69553.1 hypothetical protein DESC_750018 [Desulfosarcina cetonica]